MPEAVHVVAMVLLFLLALVALLLRREAEFWLFFGLTVFVQLLAERRPTGPPD
ncbi:hypothetical protein ACFFX1_19240 [Dactylosporangium sucinum]|nr:hypothetical protein [Dactylosporangium sucinum]